MVRRIARRLLRLSRWGSELSNRPMAGRRSARRTLTLSGESLEIRQLLAGTPMDAREQLLLELVNRARANPAAEAVRYGIDLNESLEPDEISTEPKQPLAPNQALVDAARGHSQNMLNLDFFAHENPAGEGPSDRARAAGYPAGAGENIAWFGTGGPIDENEQVYLRHEAFIVSAPHRTNLMNPGWRELGNGIKFGEFEGRTSIMVTENFGNRRGDYFITGVAYTDAVVADAFYSLGEGLGNVTVSAVRNRDDETFTTVSSPAGGYGLEVPIGVYTVTATGPGWPEPIVVRDVVILDRNQKVDFNTRDSRLGSVTGLVFEDRNEDGQRDANEPGVAGRVVFLDSDGDGNWDPDETFTETDAQGRYRVDGLRAGEYAVRQDVPAGWRQTAPEDGLVLVTLLAGQSRAAAPLGAVLENGQPVAGDDMFDVQQDDSQRIDVFANDHDPDGQLDITQTLIHEAAQHGRVELDAAAGQLVYTPEAGFIGNDGFVYSVADEEGLQSNAARVDLQVLPGPGMLWRNGALPYDVNNDGAVSPLDALLILNELNRDGPRRLPHPDQADVPPPPFLDPSGDGFVTPLDALLVLNELNEQARLARQAQFAAAVDAFWSDSDDRRSV